MKKLLLPATIAFFSLAALHAVEFEPSKLDSKKSRERREAFSEWLSGNAFEAFVEEQKQKGKHLLYIEDNGGYEYRGLFGDTQAKGWWFLYGSSIESLISVDKEKTEKRMKLLTLSESRSDRFSAIWVSENSFAEMSAALEAFGIGLASRKP